MVAQQQRISHRSPCLCFDGQGEMATLVAPSTFPLAVPTVAATDATFTLEVFTVDSVPEETWCHGRRH
jgi:hypothetical protein